jgi:hypothetical protein
MGAGRSQVTKILLRIKKKRMKDYMKNKSVS